MCDKKPDTWFYVPPEPCPYEEIGAAIGRLVEKKQHAYGNSFDHSGQILAILYPAGIRPEQYGDVLAIVRIIDKLFRIATDKTALGEDPWQDVAGYAILMNRDRQAKEASPPAASQSSAKAPGAVSRPVTVPHFFLNTRDGGDHV